MSQECCGTSTCVETPRQETVHHVQPVQVTPRADVWEAEDAFVLTIEMPGIGDADADLTLEPLQESDDGYLSFRLHYLLPLTIEAQFIPKPGV